MIGSIQRGVAAGGLAGVAYGLFTWLVTTPLIEHVERLSGAHDHGPGEGATLVGETVTAAVSAGGGVLWGVLLGAAFGVAYFLFEPALPGDDLSAYVLAGAGFLTTSVAPWTVLPPVVPGTEHAYGPDVRVALYVGLMGVGALVAAASLLGYARVADRRGWVLGAVAGGVPLAALALLAVVAPPTVAAVEASADVAGAFRWLVAFSQASLWMLIAASYRRFDRLRGDRSSTARSAQPAD